MLPFYGISTLAALGYYLNQDKRVRKETIKKDLIPEHEMPSNQDIYNSRYIENIWTDEFKKNTQQHLDMRNPKDTNIISNVFKDRQDHKVMRQRGQYDGKNIIQKENGLGSKTTKQTTKFPTASTSVIQNNKELPSAQYTEDVGTLKYNDKRRRMVPLNYKQNDTTGGWDTITSQAPGYDPK